MGLSATISGLVGGIFFIGYLLLQIPGGHLAQKVSAKKIITISMIAWGLVCISMGFVQSGGQLLTMRFLLGLSQSMLYPTALILIGKWFPQRERARAIGYWSIGATVSNFIVGPLSGFLVDTFSWKMLFVIQGIPVLIGVLFWIWQSPKLLHKQNFSVKRKRRICSKSLLAMLPIRLKTVAKVLWA